MFTKSLTTFLAAAIVLAISVQRVHSVTATPCNTPVCTCTAMDCLFEFQVRAKLTMVATVNNRGYDVGVVNNQLEIIGNTFRGSGSPVGTQVTSAHNVITADGFQRKVITINGMFPGPTLVFPEGATVKISVNNQLPTEDITIHWHGMHMKHTPWMDGVPYVTQCPIQPDHTFCYIFKALPSGTHWYHSHFHAQHGDGLFGLLVVRPAPPPIPEHFLTFIDWHHIDHAGFMVNSPRGGNGGSGKFHLPGSLSRRHIDRISTPGVVYESTLINGKGRIDMNDVALPLETFVVGANTRARFRIAHAGEEYTYRLSIDKHLLRVVAVDGAEIVPIVTEYAVLFAGETMDLEVDFDQSPDNYWFRFKVFVIGEGPNLNPVAVDWEGWATVSYSTVTPGQPATSDFDCTPPQGQQQKDRCRIFNCPHKEFGTSTNQYKVCMGMDEARSAETQAALDAEYGLQDPNPTELFYNKNFAAGGSLGSRHFIYPRTHMYDSDWPSYTVPCAGCFDCRCTNIEELTIGKTYQVVVTNFWPNRFAVHHTFHLHGHYFALLKMGYGVANASTGQIIDKNQDLSCSADASCRAPTWNVPYGQVLNFNKPPLKDTVILPAHGYVVLRFRTNNPGFWLAHCHLSNHVRPMAILFREGKENKMPIPPNDFPECKDFCPSDIDFDTSSEESSER